MKTLNKSATKIFLKLIEGLNPGDGRKIDNSSGTFMAVGIDCLDKRPYPGHPMTEIELYAVAHRYELNGDLVPDPDVEFYVVRTAPDSVSVTPTAIDLGGIFGYRRYVFFGNDGTPSKLNKKMQADLAMFCNDWMRNIKEQQEL